MKYNSVQVLRVILFLIILAFHSGVPFSNIGWFGVVVFFVISSFFLTKKFYLEDFSLIKQIKHRVLRLYPAYIVVLIVGVGYSILIKAFPYDLFFHIASVQNVLWMFTSYSSPMQPITAHTWTLSIEIILASFLLLLLRFTKKSTKLLLFVMIALAIAFRTILSCFGIDPYFISLCPISHFDSFALGALLAIAVKNNNSKTIYNFIFAIVGTIGIVSCILVTSLLKNVSLLDGYLLYSVSRNFLDNWFTSNIYLFIAMLGIGLLGMLISLSKKKEGKNCFVTSVFVYLGNNSYCLYLFHWPILLFFTRFVDNWILVFFVVLGLSILVAFLFSLFLDLIKRLFKKHKNSPTVEDNG